MSHRERDSHANLEALFSDTAPAPDASREERMALRSESIPAPTRRIRWGLWLGSGLAIGATALALLLRPSPPPATPPEPLTMAELPAPTLDDSTMAWLAPSAEMAADAALLADEALEDELESWLEDDFAPLLPPVHEGRTPDTEALLYVYAALLEQ